MRAISSLFLIGILITAIIITAGCVGTSDSSNDNRCIIAVSIVPEETWVKAIVGDSADVIVMIPPGYSPETYEPTPQQMQKLSQADIYFAIGVPSESTILPSLNPKTHLVKLQDAVSTAYPDLRMNEERDPHIWLSPKRVETMIKTMESTISETKTDLSPQIHQNAQAYLTKIAETSDEISKLLQPVQGKTFITTHPAFGYFADEYGLKMQSLEEEGKEATIQHMQELINFAKEKNVSVIFYQNETGTTQATAFAEEIGATISPLSPLEADYLGNLRIIAQEIAKAAR